MGHKGWAIFITTNWVLIFFLSDQNGLKMTLGTLIGNLSWVVRRSQTRFIIRVWHVKIQSHVVDLRTIFLTFFVPKMYPVVPSGTQWYPVVQLSSFRENGHFDPYFFYHFLPKLEIPNVSSEYYFNQSAARWPQEGANRVRYIVPRSNTWLWIFTCRTLFIDFDHSGYRRLWSLPGSHGPDPPGPGPKFWNLRSVDIWLPKYGIFKKSFPC